MPLHWRVSVPCHPRPIYPNGGVHPCGRQPVDPPGRAMLEVQAVHGLLVVPDYFTSDDFHSRAQFFFQRQEER